MLVIDFRDDPLAVNFEYRFPERAYFPLRLGSIRPHQIKVLRITHKFLIRKVIFRGINSPIYPDNFRECNIAESGYTKYALEHLAANRIDNNPTGRNANRRAKGAA